MVFKLDLHVHTLSRGKVYVDDRQLKAAIKARGIDGIAVTNFFDIEHARWLKEKLPEHTIIVGQEVWSRDGHVIGLGMTHRVNDFQTVQKTVEDIHAQGAIAVAVHPFMHHGLGAKAIEAGVDAVEVYNGIIGGLGVFNFLAGRMAQKYKLPRLSSGDTSSADFIGWNQTHVDADTAAGIIEAIKRGKTRVVRRALPLPWAFLTHNLLKTPHLKPWPVHAAPCLVCGEAWVISLKASSCQCMGCGVVDRSHLACCQGHYYCVGCLAAVGHAKALALRQREYLS
ncbi:MAG: PHP domain-containing protein [Candidatus Omnitrophica bacterium]|nr:PHP domain-containing protein [Candidatus Omnitrophota bacterium]